jgi:hypothetical protein
MANVELKDHFFRLQTGQEIPVSGILLDVPVELCHQYSVVDIETGQVLGKAQGEGILNMGTPNELEVEFPGFSERMEWIKIALVTKAMQIIATRKAAELAAIEASKNNPLTPIE